MTVSVGDVIRATAKMSQGVSDIQNVYHFKASGSGTATDQAVMDALSTKLDDAYTDFNAFLSSGFLYNSIEYFNITQDEPMGDEDWPVLTVGGTVAETLPFQTSVLCLFGTAVTKSQGRKFLPPMIETASDDAGVVSSAVVTAVTAYIVEILATKVTGTINLDPGNWNGTLVRFAEWLSGTINQFMKTQRRRVPGVGS